MGGLLAGDARGDDGADEGLGHETAGGRIAGGGGELAQRDGLAVAVEVGHAGWADIQVPLELAPLARRQGAVQVVGDEVDQLAAGDVGLALHAWAPARWGSSRVRRAWWARWRRVLTAATEIPRWVAVSSVLSSSMSRSKRTSLYGSGSSSILDRTRLLSSACSMPQEPSGFHGLVEVTWWPSSWNLGRRSSMACSGRRLWPRSFIRQAFTVIRCSHVLTWARPSKRSRDLKALRNASCTASWAASSQPSTRRAPANT